jgi:hypothetical protein
VPAIRVTGFAGMVPRRGARFLETNQAQVAINARLTSGYIGPLKQPKVVTTPGVAGIQSIFRMTDGVTDTWLSWASDVDAVKGPIAGDATYRTYYTGQNEPRVTNLPLATTGAPAPGSSFVLGVCQPRTAPTVAHDLAGGGVAVSRAFVYTFVTAWGEESAPSPASAVINGLTTGTWTITNMDVAPPNNIAVTGAAWAGGIATLNVASTFGLRIGEEISVTGMNPVGYNTASAVVTAIVPNVSVSYALTSNPGAFVAGGQINRIAPHNTVNMIKRLYWTETSSAGVTTYKLVKDNVAVALTNTTIAGNTVSSSTIPATRIGLGDPTDWPMPPVGLRGLCLHPGGFFIGFAGNTLYFSPAYIPFVFPAAYQLAVGFDIVGIKIVGTTVVVGTKGNPYSYTGQAPDGMSGGKVEQPWPCLSKQGMVDLGFGVAWPAPQGLALVGPGVSELVTQDLYTLEEWRDLAPATFIGAHYAGRYVASYQVASNIRQMLIIDKSEFASAVTANANVKALWGDPATGLLYVVIGDQIWQWDADNGVKMIFDWFSREWVLPKPINMGAAKVDADFNMTADDIAAAAAAYDAAKALNLALIASGGAKGSVNSTSLNAKSLNGSLISVLPPVAWDSLNFSLYVDGKLKFSRSLKNSKPFRLPAGYKSDSFSFRVSGNVTVKAIVTAETVKGLSEV